MTYDLINARAKFNVIFEENVIFSIPRKAVVIAICIV